MNEEEQRDYDLLMARYVAADANVRFHQRQSTELRKQLDTRIDMCHKFSEEIRKLDAQLRAITTKAPR